MKPLFSTEELINTILNELPRSTLLIIIGLIEDYFDGYIDEDLLTTLLKHI